MKAVVSVGKTGREKGRELPFSIISCGSYKEVDQLLETYREKGFEDYHLLFVAHGVIESMGRRCTDNQCLLFLPNEKQEYKYCEGKGTLYYWIHFVGTEAERLFKEMPNRVFDYTPHASEIDTLLQMMLNASIHKDECKTHYAEALLQAILMALTSRKAGNRFGKVIIMMKDRTKTYALSDYADACAMSEGHFIRRFKSEMGMSPMAYKTHEQIEYAKHLLIHTSLSVAAVAELSGFDDSAYFSRVFKKTTGVKPTQYRLNLR